jgi:hypothetical protein
MAESETQTQTKPERLTGRAASLANLIPFKPGQPTPNPAGRPPGSKKTLLRRLTDALEAEDGIRAQNVIDRIVQLAEGGTQWAAELCWDRIEGPLSRVPHDARVKTDRTIILPPGVSKPPALPTDEPTLTEAVTVKQVAAAEQLLPKRVEELDNAAGRDS